MCASFIPPRGSTHCLIVCDCEERSTSAEQSTAPGIEGNMKLALVDVEVVEMSTSDQAPEPPPPPCVDVSPNNPPGCQGQRTAWHG